MRKHCGRLVGSLPLRVGPGDHCVLRILAVGDRLACLRRSARMLARVTPSLKVWLSLAETRKGIARSSGQSDASHTGCTSGTASACRLIARSRALRPFWPLFLQVRLSDRHDGLARLLPSITSIPACLCINPKRFGLSRRAKSLRLPTDCTKIRFRYTLILTNPKRFSIVCLVKVIYGIPSKT
jgi:hypothetical protein